MIWIFHHAQDVSQGKALFGAPRCSDWHRVKTAWLKDHPECEACGSTEKVEVHHVLPFHLFPAKEKDPTNFISLCESGHYGVNCHLAIGHSGNFKKYNPDVREDAARWRRKIHDAPAA